MTRTSPPLRHWTLETVIAAIRRLHARGELASTYELARRGHEALVAAAHYHAGSWKKAMRLAGIEYTPRRSWTKESVLREMRRLSRNGASLHATKVEVALLLAARKRFGTWRKARAAALPSYDEPYEHWTERKVLDEIARLHARGVSLSSRHLRVSGHGGLVSAAIARFGSWGVAQRRAVREFEPLQQTWTRERVLRKLRERYRQGKSMSSTKAAVDDLRLHAAAHRHFGGWKAARAAAGVAYEDPRHSWPDERIVAELRRHAPDGYRPTIKEVGQALYVTAKSHFGSFDRACRAAGLRSRPGHRQVSRKRGRHR